ncbi:MAG: hypothetical protein FJ102_09495 [Deltaproteobacteria bacterium]|nr:hypothetical protein [Deltaproteobacteria bacterium]
MPGPSRNAPCPCGSGRKGKGCCGRYLDGEPAPTPEALMRSRYTAYATGACGYIVDTTLRGSAHWRDDRATWLAELRAYTSTVRFEGLVVHSSSADGDAGRVSFTARLRQGDREVDQHEDSRFQRVAGRWYYA